MARILVVDDLPEVARSIARMLCNHETSMETDPRIAVSRMVDGERFDVVLVDYNMPDMSGREVSDALSNAHLERPPIVLIMSGGENVESLFATGRAVLIKPFDGDELRDLVSAMLRDAAAHPRTSRDSRDSRTPRARTPTPRPTGIAGGEPVGGGRPRN